MKWHNGAEFTAVDVKYTIDTIKNLGSDYIYYSNVSNIESVEIVGDNLIKINLIQEEPLFQYNLTFPIICSSFFENEDITISEKSNIPMGTGMYRIEALDLSAQAELKLNNAWWNIEEKEPKIDKIYVKIYSTISEVYNAYKLGSIDILNTSRNSNIEENIGTIGYNVKETYGRKFDYLAFNCEKEVVANKEVRQAINYIIDKQDIVNNVYKGKYIVSDYPLEYGSYLYNKESSNYEHNVEKAKQILLNSGWVYSNKYWQKKINNNYVRLKVTLLVNSASEARVNVANIIKSELEEAGIQVNLVSVKDSTYENYVSKRNYDILLTEVTIGLNPSLNRYFGTVNLANYTNNEATKILDEVNNITDINLLREKYKELQSIYQAERPYIGLYFNKTTIICSKNLVGAVKPTWYNYLYNLETWYRKN